MPAGYEANSAETLRRVILTDSSVWVDHFDSPDVSLYMLLEEELVLGHPLVTGELAMGSFLERESALLSLRELEQAVVAEHDEVTWFVTQNELHGLGLSFVDAHLLVSTMLTPGTLLWTRDKLLRNIAEKLGLHADHLR